MLLIYFTALILKSLSCYAFAVDIMKSSLDQLFIVVPESGEFSFVLHYYMLTPDRADILQELTSVRWGEDSKKSRAEVSCSYYKLLL